jgi:hypothetical protein
MALSPLRFYTDWSVHNRNRVTATAMSNLEEPDERLPLTDPSERVI